MSQLYGMLIRAEKDAIMMLAKCLVESRQGSQAFDKITKMLKLQHEEMASTVPAIKEAVEPILTPELTAGIERKAKAMFGEPRKSNQRRARRKK